MQNALRSWDRMNEARAVVAKEGLTVVTAAGRPVPHPCIGIERDAGVAFRSAMRAMNFDPIEPLPAGRPPTLDGYKPKRI